MRQYNILVVDDEAFVVDWLTNLLESQTQYEFNIYPAYNPLKAMEIMDRIRIDLLITDIRMPNISGLQLIEHINKLWPFCKTILLTAHADFDYAQQAIINGVISYILKTEDDASILSHIQKALLVIDKEIDQNQLITDTQKNLSNSTSQLKHQVFFNWLRGNYLNAQELEQYMKILDFYTTASNFCLLIGSVCTLREHNMEQLNDILKVVKGKAVTEHFIHSYFSKYAVDVHENKIIWILELEQELTRRSNSIITSALELAQQACLNTINLNISYAISEPLTSATSIPEAYFIGKNIIINHNNADNFIISYPIGQPKDNSLTPDTLGIDFTYIKPPIFSTMKRYLENGSRTEFLTMLSSVCEQIQKYVNWHNNYILEAYYSIVMLLISYINQHNLSTRLAFQTSLGILFRPWLASNWMEIQNQLLLITNLLFDFQDELKKRSSQDTIQDVKDYIKLHVTDDISLIDLSEMTGYSTSYLSKFFSENVGITISEYIAQCKINKIKELMQDPALNIGDIAKLTGFNSRTYFNNYFKRNVGMAPQQYRELNYKNSIDHNDPTK